MNTPPPPDHANKVIDLYRPRYPLLFWLLVIIVVIVGGLPTTSPGIIVSTVLGVAVACLLLHAVHRGLLVNAGLHTDHTPKKDSYE